jgi:catechol 2,3-dioxygenase-like lactoylglutathione lyase family enzyme
MSTSTAHKLKLSFDAVFYYVKDLPAAITFYRDTLGLPLVSEDFVARFDLDGVLIELVPASPESIGGQCGGNARLCFSVNNLEETLEELHARGVVTSEIQHKKGGKLAFFQDPDGNQLCLWEYKGIEDPREIVHSVLLNGWKLD